MVRKSVEGEPVFWNKNLEGDTVHLWVLCVQLHGASASLQDPHQFKPCQSQEEKADLALTTTVSCTTASYFPYKKQNGNHLLVWGNEKLALRDTIGMWPISAPSSVWAEETNFLDLQPSACK